MTFRSNGQTDTFTSKETTQTYAGNISWQIAEPLRLRVAVQDRPYKQEGRLPLPNGTSNPLTAFRALGLERGNLTTTTNLDWVASSKAFFNAKINYLSYDTHRHRHPERELVHVQRLEYVVTRRGQTWSRRRASTAC